ncbi:hypothetical protein L602_002500000820 [Cupriavidus gilardii J11]|uniref:Uncharacterized protein n=1 Tax=Cupriavidus gilardii J11 TaxID=936133 RepID=A0A562BK62_9BURK|nr:hypothetical protein L602_002500000820 [Cupriavidus gilardii J11]
MPRAALCRAPAAFHGAREEAGGGGRIAKSAGANAAAGWARVKERGRRQCRSRRGGRAPFRCGHRPSRCFRQSAVGCRRRMGPGCRQRPAADNAATLLVHRAGRERPGRVKEQGCRTRRRAGLPDRLQAGAPAACWSSATGTPVSSVRRGAKPSAGTEYRCGGTISHRSECHIGSRHQILFYLNTLLPRDRVLRRIRLWAASCAKSIPCVLLFTA